MTKSTLLVMTFFILALAAALVIGFISTSDKSNTNRDESSAAINYEDLAANIDQGHMGDYENKHLRVRGYIRSFLDVASGPAIAFGEKLPSGNYPTILCVRSDFDTKAGEFRGTGEHGIYSSAFPDRLVTVDLVFTGRISSQIEVYGGKNCRVE